MNAVRSSRPRFLAAGLILLALPACRVTDLTLWKPPEHSGPYDVERIRNVPYRAGPQADHRRHRLDLFLPRGKADFPVVLLVHGGMWMMGDNRCCGLYPAVGTFLASQGIGAVLPNHRLSPFVKHPEHVEDLARAFAWTKDHIADFGGRPDQFFLLGHSSGGHLAALLATDDRYLKAEGCCSADVKGVIGISGVYRIPAGKTELHLGGTTSLGLRLDTMIPLRGPSAPIQANAPSRAGLSVRVNLFGPAFGDDPLARRSASPIHHVRPGLPPFLLLSAERDFPLLPDMAEEMYRVLLAHGCQARLARIARRNHNSILFHAIEPDDPVARAIVDFIRENAAPF
jgi:acetyl esterase/lipase